MKLSAIGVLTAAVFGIASMGASANVKLTTVTNDYTATNGCTVNSIAGGGGYNYTYTIFRVACGADVAYVQKTYNNGVCSISSAAPGYSVSSNCASYSVYKLAASSSSSSSSSSSVASSSVPAGPVTITRVINDVSDIGCDVRSVAGGANYVVYAINCPGHSTMAIQKNYNMSVCTVTPASGGVTVTGSCTDYRVKK